MDARSLNAVDRLDGAGEFAFKRTQVIDILDETCGAERVRLVEDLVADAAAFGQAALGQFHAEAGDLVLRHLNHGTVVLHFIGNALAFQILDDRRGVFIGEIGEQGGHRRGGDPHDDKAEEPDKSQRHGGHCRHPRRAQTFQEGKQTLQRPNPRDSVSRTDWAEFAYLWFPYG